MTTSRPLLAAAGLAVCLAAGCSTSSAGTTAGGSPGTSPGASQAAAVDSHDSSFGRILVTGSGTTLYLLSADSADTSTCTDAACTAVWPPLLTDGTPRVGPGVRSGLVGVTTRPDGTHQVTYASHPLYTFIPGGAAKRVAGTGFAAGQGIDSFGGTWYVVSAATGRAVTSGTTATATAEPSTSS